jgi:hypothetical protein
MAYVSKDDKVLKEGWLKKSNYKGPKTSIMPLNDNFSKLLLDHHVISSSRPNGRPNSY